MRQIFFLYFFLTYPVVTIAQTETTRPIHQVSAAYEQTLLNHPLLFSPGFNLRYNRQLIQKRWYKLSAVGSGTLVHTKNIDNRMVFGLGTDFCVTFFSRFRFVTGVRANYLLTVLAYDRYEYNARGDWENKGRLLQKFSPGAEVRFEADLWQMRASTIGVFLGVRMTRFNESYRGKIFEGYVPTVSAGVQSNF